MVKPVSLFEASSGKTFKTEFEAHKDDLIGSLTTASGNAPTAVQIAANLTGLEALHTMSEAIIGMMAHHPQTPVAACPVEAATMPEIRADDPEHATHVRDGKPLCGTAPPQVDTRPLRGGGYCDVPGMNGRGDW